jgi:hypothetical protein
MANAQSMATGSVLTIPQASNANFSTILKVGGGSNVGIAGGVTNASTGPTVAATVALMGSIDGTNWYMLNRIAAQTGSAVVTPFSFEFVNEGWQWLALYVYGNTGTTGGVTLNAVAAWTQQFS